MKKHATKLKLKDVHLLIPHKEYEFLAEESKKKGISMALYVANLLRKEKLGSEVTSPKDAKKSFSLEFTELTNEELEKKLQAFEMKYKLDSETLYQLYQQGKVPEWIEDRILWAGLYRLKKDENDVE
ncbi:hypothetical protein FJZ31_18835 [Candidatus Poribacteria bacterium]|nr:hypothetical protein [Candidatus Poribacteria bacterium]